MKNDAKNPYTGNKYNTVYGENRPWTIPVTLESNASSNRIENPIKNQRLNRVNPSCDSSDRTDFEFRVFTVYAIQTYIHAN